MLLKKSMRPLTGRPPNRRASGDLDGSAITPHWSRLVSESSVIPDPQVDRDCDQIRAMIKIFVTKSWDWSIETFRLALGVTRDQLLSFLKKRGTNATQLQSLAYLRSWEFFNRRQQMGLSIVNVDFRDDLSGLEEKHRLERLTEAQRALDKTHKEAVEALEKKHHEEPNALERLKMKWKKH